jgi:two-component system KDP operon response regulator KdpE
MDELFARIRVALRRSSMPANSETATIELGDFTIDQNARMVKIRGKEIHLTPKEYDLLLYLIQNPGRVLTHRTLLGAVWGGESVEQSEYLRVFIGQLRKKIEVDPAKPQYIVTEPWIGYRFIPEH